MGREAIFCISISKRGEKSGNERTEQKGQPKGSSLRDTTPTPELEMQFRLCHSLEQVTFFPLSFPICKMKASPQIWKLWPSWRRRKAHRLEMGDRRETQQNVVGKGAGEQNTVKRRRSSPSPGTQQRAVGNVAGPSPAAVGQEQSHTPLTALASPLSKGWGRRA